MLAVLETDKVVAEIPAPKQGTLKSFKVAEGEVIQVGETLAVIETADGSKPSAREEKTDESVGVVGELTTSNEVLATSNEGQMDGGASSTTATKNQAKVKSTPVARKLAHLKGIDIQSVKGSGPGGRILKADVESALNTKPVQKEVVSAPVAGGTTVNTLSTMRKSIARNMEKSHQIPSFTMQEEACLDALLSLRNEFLEPETGKKLSLQAYFIKMLAVVLKKYPIFNATYDEKEQAVTVYDDINIGVAVDTEEGVIVPVINNVDQKSILELNFEIRNLTAKALERKLTLNQLEGGSFSVTNFGLFGGLYGTPFILPPQVAIMGFGRLHDKPRLVDGNLQNSKILPLSSVFDHRVIDGAPAGKFITAFINLLENPLKLIHELK